MLFEERSRHSPALALGASVHLARVQVSALSAGDPTEHFPLLDDFAV